MSVTSKINNEFLDWIKISIPSGLQEEFSQHSQDYYTCILYLLHLSYQLPAREVLRFRRLCGKHLLSGSLQSLLVSETFTLITKNVRPQICLGRS